MLVAPRSAAKLNAEDWDGWSLWQSRRCARESRPDVNVDYAWRDGVRDMHELVSRLLQMLLLMLDSTEWEKMEGLKVASAC